MTKGKVVLVSFPFDDLSATKVRPAVCLTEPIGPHRHVILAFITSRIPADLLETDLVLDSTHADFGATRLEGVVCASAATSDDGDYFADSARTGRVVTKSASRCR